MPVARDHKFFASIKIHATVRQRPNNCTSWRDTACPALSGCSTSPHAPKEGWTHKSKMLLGHPGPPAPRAKSRRNPRHRAPRSTPSTIRTAARDRPGLTTRARESAGSAAPAGNSRGSAAPQEAATRSRARGRVRVGPNAGRGTQAAARD